MSANPALKITKCGDIVIAKAILSVVLPVFTVENCGRFAGFCCGELRGFGCGLRRRQVSAIQIKSGSFCNLVPE
jgi:hypothetical protein